MLLAQALLPALESIHQPSAGQAFSYSNLLQELLLALVGFSGDVFITTGGPRSRDCLIQDPDRCNLVLSPDLDWVDAPDRALLNELVKLGYHYAAVQAFVEHERSSACRMTLLGQASGQGGLSGQATAAEGQPEGSIFRQALAVGLTEALDIYQHDVVAVQQTLLAQGSANGLGASPPVLSSLHHQLHDYKVLLPQLHRLVYCVSGREQQQHGHGLTTAAYQSGSVSGSYNPVTNVWRPDTSVTSETDTQQGRGMGSGKPLCGAAVLALVSDMARSGLPALQSTLQRLLWHCYQALHKQLASWMVYGQLLDPYQEFFIRTTPAAAALTAQHLAGSYQQHTHTIDWVNSFEVVLDNLPACISLDTANAIAFVGKAVLLLKHPAGEFRGRLLLSHQDTQRAAQALQALQAQPVFDRLAFDCCVLALRAKAAALLWQLVVQQAGLMTHLTAFKDYFLLAKGEFVHEFLLDARRLLSLPPRPQTADVDVGAPWQTAALKSSAQYDTLFPLFKLHWAPVPVEGQPQVGLPPQAITPATVVVPSFDANWDGIWLEAGVDWPLGLLLTPPIMARYNALFQLLLRLKRVQMALEGCWVKLCAMSKAARAHRSTGQKPGGSDPLLAELQQLRHHMAHLITNLQIYLQVDVIETNFSQLEQRIADAQDFTEVERAHAHYLHAMMAQAFLTTKTVGQTITAVFRHVADLHRLVDHVDSSHLITPSPLDKPSAALEQHQKDRVAAQQTARRIATGFQKQLGELYIYLHSTSLLDANRAPHLRQLYMRLNYNEYLGHKMVSSTVARGPATTTMNQAAGSSSTQGTAARGPPTTGVSQAAGASTVPSRGTQPTASTNSMGQAAGGPTVPNRGQPTYTGSMPGR